MKIKNILTICLVCCGFSAVLTSCNKDSEALFTVSEDDSPRILNTDFPDGGFSINRDANLKFEVLVTPADFTTVKWFVDGQEVYVGNTIDKAFEAGDYTVKIVATTVRGKETSRTMGLKVKPLADDPVAEEKPAERLQSPGAVAKVSGSNMTAIKAVSINGIQATVTSSADNYVEYTVPEGLADGQYRISLIDGEKHSYGGGIITVTNNATVSKAAFSAKAGDKLDLPGCKLTDVATVTINGLVCEILNKEDANLIVKVPEMEEGTYEIKATTTSGVAVKFLGDDGLVEVASVKITLIPETVLWEGKHEVDWGTIWEDKDGSVTAIVKQEAKVGYTLRLYVKRTDTEYAMGCAAINWADIVNGGTDPNRGDVTISFEDTYIDFVLTAKSFELLNGGNLQVVGHGFDLTKMSLIPSSEVTLWEGKHSVDWGTIWEDKDGSVSAQIKENAGVGSVLRLYCKRTASDYCQASPTVNWANLITGLSDPDRGDKPFDGEDTLEYTLTAKSMELLGQGNLQVVGHGFDLIKITIE
jgi:hypothetical protein